MPVTEFASNLIASVPKQALLATVGETAGKREAIVAGTFGKDVLTATPPKGGMVNHARFFDTNFDGKISYTESRVGLQDLKFGDRISYVLAGVANLVLGEGARAPAGSSLWYRLKNLFTVDLDHLTASAKAEAGGVALDPIKRVDSQMKFDTGNKGSLTLAELSAWVDAEHPGGSNGRTKLGFGQLVQIGADTTKVVSEKGVDKTMPAISRTSLEHFYEGTLFYDIAARNGHPHPLAPNT
jgi:hypothetical protein